MNETSTGTGKDEGDMDLSEDFNDLFFFRNVSLFYLKLHGEFLLPALTIQNIVEQNKHELGQKYSLSKLTDLLKNHIIR